MGNPLVLSAFDRVSEEIHSKNHPHPKKDLQVGLRELLETPDHGSQNRNKWLRALNLPIPSSSGIQATGRVF